MIAELQPIRSEADYQAALAEVERLWGMKSGTPDRDRLDILATLIDIYESEHDTVDPPDPAEVMNAARTTQLGSPSVCNGWRADRRLGAKSRLSDFPKDMTVMVSQRPCRHAADHASALY